MWGHTLRNTSANVYKFTSILYDRNKTPEEKINSIISEIMVPNQLDVIVTGQYTEKGDPDPIFLKLFLIDKNERKSGAKSLKPHICADIGDKIQKVLCASSHEEIANAVKKLLEAL